MYYTVIKHSRHFRTLKKCRKLRLVFSTFLSQSNTRLRLHYLLNKGNGNTICFSKVCSLHFILCLHFNHRCAVGRL